MTASDFNLRQSHLALLAQLCAESGLSNVIISPGSRSAPLTATFASHSAFQCRVVYDERSAGYIALGIAQQTNLPTILICTSGTAALNYTPAVAEAYYQQVPLLLLTADRPPEWIDQQDNQAIHQERLYEPHLQASYTFPSDISHPDARWHVRRLLSEAIARCTRPVAGPVHINVPLREPLYPPPEGKEGNEGKQDSEGAAPGNAAVWLSVHPQLTDAGWTTLTAHWQKARRKLVVAGMHRPNSRLRTALHTLSQRADTAVIADITANLFPDATPLVHADAILSANAPAVLASLQPDLIVSYGGPVTSKSFKQFLRNVSPQAHWRLQPAGPVPDTYQNLTHVLPVEPESFFMELTSRLETDRSASSYVEDWRRLEQEASTTIDRFLDAAPFGEFKASWQVLRVLPAGSVLQLGNSMPIRYANLIGLSPQTVLAGVYSNRGTSGIDGTVSTAVGAALASGRLTTLITGDLAFFYDRNGLWHDHLPSNLRIVLLNNHGGGIFDIIDGPGRLPRALQETYFLTPQRLTAERTAADHGLNYWYANDEDGLLAALPRFFQPSDRPGILEIETKMAVNSQVFSEFKRMIETLISTAD
ncbi:MAG: 2-succinyl-5-enolpyruvyl-6-hydroxy-3-cyclohexene-1-carboxylic-acid synthase [Anaerolineae bacterium]|nr:2-succinyl-5-enolpyruvyl-6-hydroxy-3-cyclohexene-1-carboxylic-acid synthase [Anaerolineae bacterium]